MVYWALLTGVSLLGIAAGQWLVLRPTALWARSLLLAELSGGVAGVGIGTVSFGVAIGVTNAAAATGLAFFGGCVALGIVKWLALRTRVAWASRWAVASGAGLLVALIGASVFTFLFLHAIGDVLGAQLGQIGVALFRAMQGLVLGSLYGVATGGVRIRGEAV